MPHSTLLPTQFILYADDGYASHVVRLLLAEKQLDFHLQLIKDDYPEILAQLNPYGTLPILAGRDLALYEINVIFEYLEERFAIHSLLPADPKQRAMVRTLAWRIQKDWFYLGDDLQLYLCASTQKNFVDILTTLSPIFEKYPFFMSETFGWCDVLLLPLLWRLPKMGVILPKIHCQGLLNYQQRLFARPSFQKSIKPPTQEQYYEPYLK